MSVIDRSYEEKRDFIRMQINSPITITRGQDSFTGTCIDLSGTGLMVTTDATLAIGDECDVNIEQKEDGRLPFNAQVKVTRIDSNEEGSNTIGFSIAKIT